MRVLICGSRDYLDRWHVFKVLSGLRPGPTCIIHGACGWDLRKTQRLAQLRGVDRFADEWARLYGVPIERYPADWSRLGRRAGPARIRQMLAESRPDLVIAFDGGLGTARTMMLARDAGVPVREVSRTQAKPVADRPNPGGA